MNYRHRTRNWIFTAALTLGLFVPLVNGMGSPAMNSLDRILTVIPAPTSWQPAGGSFSLADLQRVVVPAGRADLLDTAKRAAVRLDPGLDRRLPVQLAGPGDWPAGSLIFLEKPDLLSEAYTMEITTTGIELSAAGPAGFHHGITTLIQLALNGQAEGLPTGVIRDQPRYGWRGMLLDCGRHFMPVPTIKALLDKLALHKFNVLHWHLTEDQGWRLEIPGYPLLTEVGAWRTEPDGTKHGGYYTADDVREIVAYAAERFITVVPEIEMPGHSQAALAAYPHLSCTGGPFEVQTQWGIHADVLCPGREDTFAFLEDVLTYVMELFPGNFIHIGGDEVPKDRWRDCEHCQERLRTEGLANEEELQSWFIARIGKFLASQGRRLIGWDEILTGGLPGDPDTYVIQAWRGMDEAAAAARAGHDVIASPTSHAYFDYDPGVLDLQQVFEFRPVPADLDKIEAEHILGGQMNLWTEYIPAARVDAMLFPRLTAMAEALWTGAEDRDFALFLDRLHDHGPVLEHLGVRPGAAARPVLVSSLFEPEEKCHRLKISLDPRIAQALTGRDLATRYRLLESPLPASFDPALMPEEQGLSEITLADGSADTVLDIPSAAHPEKSWLLQAGLFVDGRPYGAPALLEISGHAALNADLTFARLPSERYPGGGPRGLVNGLHGSRFFQDGHWTGFEGEDMVVTVALDRAKDLRGVSVRFLQDANAWVFLPREVRVMVSDDGHNWRQTPAVTHGVSDRQQEKMIHEFSLPLPDEKIRFLRIHAVSPRICPDWHPGSGGLCWIMADEIVCR